MLLLYLNLFVENIGCICILTIEGKAKPKYDRFGNPRHKFGKGIIGADIGTQTVAYTIKY